MQAAAATVNVLIIVVPKVCIAHNDAGARLFGLFRA